MGKPKKEAAETPVTAASALAEESLFVPDQETDSAAKNRALAVLLGGPWKGRAIVRVERIEIGDSGWRVIYRE